MKKLLLFTISLFCLSGIAAQNKHLQLEKNSERVDICAGKDFIISLMPEIIVRQWIYLPQKALVDDKLQKVIAGMTVNIARYDRRQQQWISFADSSTNKIFDNRKLKIYVNGDSLSIKFRKERLTLKIPENP